MKRKINQDQHAVDGISPSKSPAPKRGGNARFEDNRSELTVQRKLQEGMDSSSQNGAPIQPKANKTGLPDNLKSGIENLSGFAMDDVKVHYNSSKPAQLKAHAYAQGTEIHLAPGQEKQLPHEAWHVVQQKQGRVQPTRQLKSKVAINDDAGLEMEADVMGVKALQGSGMNKTNLLRKEVSASVAQRVPGEKAIINLVFAGSGHDYITDDRNPDKEGSEFKDTAEDWTQEEDVFLRKMKEIDSGDGTIESEFEIAGPGAPVSGGKGFGGNLDHGTNCIGKLTEVIPQWIMNMRDDLRGKEVEFNIWGHSRGGVAGAYVAEKLAEEFPGAEISYAGYDPVPGPYPFTSTDPTDLSSVTRSAVVYAIASGTQKFGIQAPIMQPKMLTPKVLILTANQHSANMKGSFIFEDKEYRGSEVSKFPPGVYYESTIELAPRPDNIQKNKWKQGMPFTYGKIRLEKLHSNDKKSIDEVFKFLSRKKHAPIDFGRTKIIKATMKSVMEANGVS